MAAPVPLEENTQTMHFHKQCGPALAQPWTLILDTESASASYLQCDVCLACRAELTLKAEFTLDDTQERQG